MTDEEVVAFVYASRLESIADAAMAAADVAERAGFAPDALFGIDMAVREAVTNAVLHGNKQDASKKVEMTMRSDERELEIIVRDRGEGFDPARVPDPTTSENLLNTSGRGILFMRNFMDTVEWRTHAEGGTAVRMTKRK